MYVELILLFVMHQLIAISGDGIAVLFNTTMIFDNSTITWVDGSAVNETSCFPQTTIEVSNYPNTTVTTTTTTTTTTTVTTTTTTITTTTIMATTTAIIQLPIDYTCPSGDFGVNCDISSDICAITTPCLNGATCSTNNLLSLGYSCQCPIGFTGYDCDIDNRVCTPNTCWNNGTCTELSTIVSGINLTSFTCQCVYGYDGISCQVITDMCANITCENNGICASSYLLWACKCLDSSLYSGTYCQDKSSSLVTKEAISKSLGIIAIISLCCVFGFVFIMDILKYVFNIDPIDREEHRLKMEKEKEKHMKFSKKKIIKKKNKLIITRFSNIV